MTDNYPKAYLYKRIVQAKLFIDTHFGDNIDLDNIADEAYFSKFHFIRLFKTIYGKPPYQYLTSVRIEKAKDLLQKGNTIAETCFNVGFESISSFTGLFKRCTNFSPSEYQQEFFKREQQIKKLRCNSSQTALLNAATCKRHRKAILKKCIEKSLLMFAIQANI